MNSRKKVLQTQRTSEDSIRAEIASSHGAWTGVYTANMGVKRWNLEGLGFTAARFGMLARTLPIRRPRRFTCVHGQAARR